MHYTFTYDFRNITCSLIRDADKYWDLLMGSKGVTRARNMKRAWDFSYIHVAQVGKNIQSGNAVASTLWITADTKTAFIGAPRSSLWRRAQRRRRRWLLTKFQANLMAWLIKWYFQRAVLYEDVTGKENREKKLHCFITAEMHASPTSCTFGCLRTESRTVDKRIYSDDQKGWPKMVINFPKRSKCLYIHNWQEMAERGGDTTELCKTMKWLDRKLMLPVSENQNGEHWKKKTSRKQIQNKVLNFPRGFGGGSLERRCVVLACGQGEEEP